MVGAQQPLLEILICIFLKTDGVGLLLIYLLDNCVFHFVKHLFMFFAHF